jgi:hypothetical protein
MNHLDSPSRRNWIWPALIGILALTAVLLATQGRLWACSCGRIDLWAGDIWSSDNSQHIADPYSFTHVLHGVAFAGVLALVSRRVRLPVTVQFIVAMLLESLWEVVENSAAVIERYRATTSSLGYTGDTVVNAISDIVMCAFGFWLARRIGWKWSLALFVVTELVLVLWIKDSLLLNILMLLSPVEAIRQWQIAR